MLAWLSKTPCFPDPMSADASGLLAAGGDLSQSRLLEAYRQGIFPWYAQGEPILWWSPDPRMVIFPSEFKWSRTLRRQIRRRDFALSLNGAFEQVVRSCAQIPRAGQSGTWITPAMRQAYQRLHEAGYAHSLEVWKHNELCGGLYGIRLGNLFFGESMFSKASNASKLALAALASPSMELDVIDCQIQSVHLAAMGARAIPRAQFLRMVRKVRFANKVPWLLPTSQDLFAHVI